MTASGAPDPGGPGGPPPARSGRGYWLPGLIAMVALLIIAGAIGAGDLEHRSPGRLAGSDVAQQLALGMQAQAGSSALPEVHCPASEPVRNGWTFVCTEVRAGVSRPIQVTEIDSRGHLRWRVGA